MEEFQTWREVYDKVLHKSLHKNYTNPVEAINDQVCMAEHIFLHTLDRYGSTETGEPTTDIPGAISYDHQGVIAATNSLKRLRTIVNDLHNFSRFGKPQEGESENKGLKAAYQMRAAFIEQDRPRILQALLPELQKTVQELKDLRKEMTAQEQKECTDTSLGHLAKAGILASEALSNNRAVVNG